MLLLQFVFSTNEFGGYSAGEEGNCSHRALTKKKHNSQYGEGSSEIAQIILFYTLISLN